MKEKTIIFYVAGVAALGCAAVLGYYFVWPIYKEGELSKANEAKILAAKTKVLDTLMDPSSAQFRNTSVDFRDSVCGEVNAKNAFGGYVGYRWFYVNQAEITVDHPDAAIKLAEVMCKNRR